LSFFAYFGVFSVEYLVLSIAIHPYPYSPPIVNLFLVVG